MPCSSLPVCLLLSRIHSLYPVTCRLTYSLGLLKRHEQDEKIEVKQWKMKNTTQYILSPHHHHCQWQWTAGYLRSSVWSPEEKSRKRLRLTEIMWLCKIENICFVVKCIPRFIELQMTQLHKKIEIKIENRFLMFHHYSLSFHFSYPLVIQLS